VVPEFSLCLGYAVVMYMFASNDRDRVLYERDRYVRFFLGVRGLVSGLSPYGVVRDHFLDADVPLWVARNYYRDGSCHASEISLDSSGGAAMLYVGRCLGHRVRERDVLKYPRLCVLWAKRVLEGRWRAAEGVIGGDHVACRLYSEFVVHGRLPDAIHNRLVMETMLERSPVLDPYFAGLHK